MNTFIKLIVAFPCFFLAEQTLANDYSAGVKNTMTALKSTSTLVKIFASSLVLVTSI